MLKRGQFERGDTLIEVLFAITIFSLVVVATLALMNQGTSAARRSVEMTLVREQIDAQAEALRFLHESYVTQYLAGTTYDLTGATSPAEEYAKIIDRVKVANRQNATPFDDGSPCPDITPSDGFIVNPRTAMAVFTPAQLQTAAQGYARITYTNGNVTATSNGIWIEAIRTVQESSPSLTQNAGYIDFYIRACWAAPGLEAPLTMGTIVRLYEPRG